VSTYVVKMGGHALDSLSPDAPVLVDLAFDIAELRNVGHHVVVVHGGGPQIVELLSTVGVESRFAEGLRITDEVTMRYVAMALSEVNIRIVASLAASGLAPVGLSGADASVLRAEALGAPWFRAGKNPVVHSDVLKVLLESGFTPVMSSVAVDSEGELLNCNADTAAGAVAGALGASLLLLSDIDQLRSDPDDPQSALSSVSASTVHELIASGAARDGMRPKMTAALDALAGGATRIIMANGTRPHALREAIANAIPTTEVLA
jgi:acetylglutamate kinase